MKYTSMRLRPSYLAQAGLSCAGKGVFAGHSSSCSSWTNTDSYAMVGRALRKWNSGGATWQIWAPKQHWFVGYWAWEGMSLRDLKVALNGPQSTDFLAQGNQFTFPVLYQSFSALSMLPCCSSSSKDRSMHQVPS